LHAVRIWSGMFASDVKGSLDRFAQSGWIPQRCQLVEVAGTLATLDDKVLILTDTEAQQKRLFQRLKIFMYDVR
jgi:hypothetical protein